MKRMSQKQVLQALGPRQLAPPPKHPPVQSGEPYVMVNGWQAYFRRAKPPKKKGPACTYDIYAGDSLPETVEIFRLTDGEHCEGRR